MGSILGSERAQQSTPVFLPENPMDRGAWWAAVQSVTKSWTWLKQLSVRTCNLITTCLLSFPSLLRLAVSLKSLCFSMRKSNMNSDYWKEDTSSFFNLKLRDLEFKKSEADFKVSALNWHCDTTLDRNERMGTNMYSQPPTQRDGSLSLCTGALFTSYLLLHRETKPQSSSCLPKVA